jgi:AraC-like DNA-binding protein
VTEHLASAPVIATHSLEAAREAVTRIYLRHDLAGPDGAMNMRLNAITDRQMTFGYLTYQADAVLTMPATEDFYIVNLTVEGRTWASRGDGVRERTAAHERGLVLSPVKNHRVRWSSDAEQLHLKIFRANLESHLADLLGQPVTNVVDFDFGLDLTKGTGRGLLRAVEFLASELDRPAGLAELPLAHAQLEAYVLSSLLYAGRHQFSNALADNGNACRLGRLAPVLQYIEANADSELTPTILARVACVSVRTLHAAFLTQLGESPMAYVRRVRLGRVRAELLRSDPSRVRVTDIAMRWGFLHLSRFAQQYRDQFNELPSVTLHR